MTDFNWTPQAVETLKGLYAGGHSASEISRTLRGTTRNSVIGKLHRLGEIKPERAATARDTAQLQNRLTTGSAGPNRKLSRKEANPLGVGGAARIKASVEAVLKADPRPIRAVSIGRLDLPLSRLAKNGCRWIEGDAVPADGSPALYCGHPSEGEKPYCCDHAAICFTKLRGPLNTAPTADRRRFNGRQFGGGGRAATYGE